MRAFAQLLVARAYAGNDKSKAIELLRMAFTSTLMLPEGEEETVRGRIAALEKADLQRQILDSLVTLSPAEAEEKLPLAVPAVREHVFAALIGYYQKNNRFDAALDAIHQIARDAAFPYVAARRLMSVLPPEKFAERQQLFADALNSFRTHPPARDSLGFDAAAFPAMIVQHWKGLPVPLVREAIDEALKQADTNPDGALPVRVTVGYGRGATASLSSMYEYRLFQLLPVLQEIDPSSAESLLRDHEPVRRQFDAYAQAGSPAIRSVGGSRSGAPLRQTRPELRTIPGESTDDLVQRIMAVESAETRASFLLATARQVEASDPSTAKACLDKLVEPVAGQLKSDVEQVSTLLEATNLYLDLKETAGARKAIAVARAAADRLYAVDNDSSNPNVALKAYWPSTGAYLKLVRSAGRVSPDLALAIVNEMKDDEVRPVIRLALAGAWTGAPIGEVTVINKEGALSQETGLE